MAVLVLVVRLSTKFVLEAELAGAGGGGAGGG